MQCLVPFGWLRVNHTIVELSRVYMSTQYLLLLGVLLAGDSWNDRFRRNNLELSVRFDGGSQQGENRNMSRDRDEALTPFIFA